MTRNFEIYRLRTIIGGVVLTIATLAPVARAELVYDNDDQQQQRPEPRADDRESTRKVLKTGQKTREAQVQSVVQVQPVQRQVVVQATAPQAVAVQTEPATTEDASSPEYQSLSKSELLRRERMRQELRNEDVIQERLEELRLRDEKKRTQQMFKNNGDDADATAPTPPAPAAMTEEVVAVPVTERPAEPAYAAPAAAPRKPSANQQAAMVMPAESSAQSAEFESRASVSVPSEDEKTTVRISPRAGVANMSGSGNVKVNSRYSLGVGLSVDASENMAFEIGYTYNEFGIELAQPGYFVPTPNMGNLETRALKQNVIDAGLKFYLLGSSSKIRPYVGGGAAYSKGYVNFDEKYAQMMATTYNQQGVQDYEITQFLGYLSAGLDVKLSKSVNVGAQFRYYNVLSSSAKNDLTYNSFYGYQQQPGASSSYYPYAANSGDQGNQAAGNALDRSSFYSILAGVSFAF